MAVQPQMKFLTDFGDLAVLLPLSALLAVWLMRRSLRAGAWWLAAFMLCAGGTALLKICFVACSPLSELQSPSGHASLATLVYGAIGGIAALRWQGWRRAIILAATASFVLAIALSRVALGHHAPPEVVLGLVIGGGSLALFLRGYDRVPPGSFAFTPLLAASVLVAGALHGHALHAEEMLHAISSAVVAPVCTGER